MAFDRAYIFERSRATGLSMSELARRGGLARKRKAQQTQAAEARVRRLPECPSCGAELQRGMCPVCG